MKKVTNDIGIIGYGKMGIALAKGLSTSTVYVTNRTGKLKEKSKKIVLLRNNFELLKKTDLIILCVKPKQVETVISEIAQYLTKNHILVSICAGISIHQINNWIKKAGGIDIPIYRAMPNTPALINEGITALSSRTNESSEVENIFKTVGKTLWVDENLLDAVTGLSGCGPAYVYLIIEALSEAGVKLGLSREHSVLLASQTLMGASKMLLERKVHPAFLKDEVTTPAGCTIDGLMALEEGRLRVTLIKAVLAAAQRSKELNEMDV